MYLLDLMIEDSKPIRNICDIQQSLQRALAGQLLHMVCEDMQPTDANSPSWSNQKASASPMLTQSFLG